MSDVRQVNANLLVALDTLLEEVSVTRAARRLGVTQSAMSNTLVKLRRLFDDPLLVRSGRGMVLTTRAERLREPLRRGVGALQSVLSPGATFDPGAAEWTLRLKASDYVQSVLVPPLLQRLACDAPGARLQLSHGAATADYGGLETGDADLYIAFEVDPPAHHESVPLFDEELVCIARKDHPRIDGELSIERYLELEHVVVSDRPGVVTIVDRHFAALGHRRKVALYLPHFLMVPPVIAQTDFVAAVNGRTAQYYAPRFDLRIHPLPPRPLGGTVGMVWHRRTHHDPAQAWSRALIADLSRTL